MNGQPIGPRAQVEAALLAAMTVMIGLVVVTVPLANMLLVALPVPTAVSAYRHPWQTAALGGLVAVLLGAMVPSVVFAATTILPMVLIGAAIGASFRRPLPVWAGFLLTWAGTVVALGLGFLAAAVLFFGGPAGVGQAVAASLRALRLAENGTLGALPGFGIPQSEVAILRTAFRTLEPTLIALSLLTGPSLSYLLTWTLFGRLGYRRPPILPPRLWTLPPWAFVLYLIAMIFPLLGPLLHSAPLATAGANLLLPTSLAMMVQGLAVALFFLHKSGWPPAGRWAVAAAAFLLLGGLLPTILVIVGMFDSLMDLRGVSRGGPGNARGNRI